MKKIIIDGWADYEGEVSRFNDQYPDNENIIKEEVPIEEESDSRHSLLKVTLTYRAGMETRGKFGINSSIGHNTSGTI